MSDLSRWFERQARRERRAVFLEEALIGTRFWAYSWYRLRYFLARYAIASATHAVTVVLLYRFFDRRQFVIVLLVYAAVSVVTNFWWGALEAMRTEVRRLYRLRVPHRIPEAVGRWLSLSLQLTLLTALGVAAWLAHRLLSGDALGPADLYVLAILLWLSLQFYTRAYHSGIYAIRRIYRPLPVVLGVELVGVVAALALVPVLGAWALPAGVLVSTPTVAGLSLYYTHRAYWFLGLSPAPFVSLTRLWLPPRRALRDFLGGGIAYAIVGIDSLLVLVLFTTERDPAADTGLFALFFLVSPTVRACSDWAQLVYFDLKRLEIRLFRNLKRRFEHRVLGLAVVLGLGFAGVAASIGSLASSASVSDLAWALAPLFVSLSLLAAVQIEAYAERAYPVLIGNGALCLAGYVLAGAFGADERTTVLLLAAVAFGGFLSLQLRRESSRHDERRALLPATEWLAELCSVGGPVRVVAARFHGDPASARDDSWRRQEVAEGVARKLRGSGSAALIEPSLLAWYERLGSRPVTGDRSVSAVGGGLLRPMGSSTGSGGLAALRGAARKGILGRDLAAAAAGTTRPLDVEQLRASFVATFTSGIVFAPDEPVPARLDALPSDHKRVVLAEALAFARELRVRRSRSAFEVTALCDAGELRLIFLVSRRAPRRLRERWETRVRRANLRAATALPSVEAGSPRRLEPLLRAPVAGEPARKPA